MGRFWADQPHENIALVCALGAYRMLRRFEKATVLAGGLAQSLALAIGSATTHAAMLTAWPPRGFKAAGCCLG